MTLNYSKAVSWIDNARIPFVDEKDIQQAKTHFAGGNGEGRYNWNNVVKKSGNEYKITQGRFPANLLVSDDMLNDGSISKQSNRKYKPTDKSASLFGNTPQAHGIGIGDSGTNSRYYDIDKWFDKLLEDIE